MIRLGLICFILFCFILKTKGQNLVPNPSFEFYVNCGNAYINNAVDWEMLNNGTSTALLISCQADSYLRTPRQYLDACFQSYQTVRTASAYAEFGVYTTFVNSQESGHPACKLLDTLEAGKIYCVTYYVSMWNNARYSLDKLGALLTPTPFPYYVSGTTTPTFSMAGLYTPQVVTTPGVVFEDTLGWEEVSGTFTATGNEAYLTLGDFFLHNQHFIKDSYPSNCNGLAEYYIDDVSVEEVEIAKAKNDTLINQGDSTIIGLNNSEAALFSWQPTAGLSCTNCPNPKASPTITTTYTVTKTQCKVTTNAVITVSVSPVGVREMSYWNEVVGVSPNPTSGNLKVSIKNISEAEHLIIKITDVLGKEVLLENYAGEISISTLENGIYFLSFYKNNQLLVTKKVIKQ